MLGIGGHPVVHGLSGESGPFGIDPVRYRLKSIVGLGCPGRIEGIGLYDMGAGPQVGPVNVGNDIGTGQVEQVVVALQLRLVIEKVFTAIILLAQLVALDHGSHGAVDNRDTLFQQVNQPPGGVAGVVGEAGIFHGYI